MITEKGHSMLAAFHGLDPKKHTDDDVSEAIKNAVTDDDLEELTNRAEKAEKELAETKVTGDLAKYANRIGKDEKIVAHWKNALISNRDAAVAMLEALPEQADKGGKPAPLHNRNTAASPKPLDTDAAAEGKANAQASKVANRAADLRKGGMSHRAAFNQAQREFATE